jgi:hypothetical protein
VPGDAAAGHLEADHLARGARGLAREQRLAADEVALLELDRPAEPGLERVGGLVDLVAVEREARLEPERVAGAEPDGLDAGRLAEAQELAPDGGRVVPGAEELEAVFARVARAGRRHRHARDGERPETEALGLGHGRGRLGPGRRENGRRLGALERDEAGLVGGVAQVAVVFAEARQVRADLVAVRGVADDENAVGRVPVDDEIVDHRAALVAEQRVERAAVFEAADVVGHQVVGDRPGVLAGEPELAHVADVEEPRRAPHGEVLVDDPGVLDRHLPAGEGHQPAAERAVVVVEGRAAEGGFGVGHGAPLPRPSGCVTPSGAAAAFGPERVRAPDAPGACGARFHGAARLVGLAWGAGPRFASSPRLPYVAAPCARSRHTSSRSGRSPPSPPPRPAAAETRKTTAAIAPLRAAPRPPPRPKRPPALAPARPAAARSKTPSAPLSSRGCRGPIASTPRARPRPSARRRPSPSRASAASSTAAASSTGSTRSSAPSASTTSTAAARPPRSPPRSRSLPRASTPTPCSRAA